MSESTATRCQPSKVSGEFGIAYELSPLVKQRSPSWKQIEGAANLVNYNGGVASPSKRDCRSPVKLLQVDTGSASASPQCSIPDTNHLLTDDRSTRDGHRPQFLLRPKPTVVKFWCPSTVRC